MASRRCSHYAGMSKKCVVVSWLVLERQRAKIDDYFYWEKVAEERVVQKILEHRIYIRRLKQTQELLKKYFIIKTEEELLVQDKEIKEYIARKNLSSDE